jgi:predicted phage terminase large subunit-like protein
MPDLHLLENSTREEAWRLGIASFAAVASRARTHWIPYRWLLDLASRIIGPLLAGNARIVINAPPRHGKSELISHWLPVWYLEHWPMNPIILASYGGDLAASMSRKIRDEFIMNPNCTVQLRTDSRATTDWLTMDGGGLKSAGVGGPITGRGAKLVIIDDPHKNWEEAMRADARERVVDWYKSTLYTRLEPNASIILVQTRWHEHDLSGYLIDSKKDNWTVLKYPAIAEEEHDIIKRNPGECLCPERYTVDTLNQIKERSGSHIFAGLYQQRPAPIFGGIIKKDWFKFYQDHFNAFDEWAQFWDLTFKATGTSYAVGQVWARKGVDYYIIDQVRKKMDFIEQIREITSLSNCYPLAMTKCIEDAADAQAVKATLDQAVPGILLVPARGSKEARLASVAGIIESGHVYLPANAPWIDDFIFELTSFPSTVNDDQVDACSHALSYFTSRVAVDYGGLRLPSSGRRDAPWEI